MRKLSKVNTTTNSIEMYSHCHGWGCKTYKSRCLCNLFIYGESQAVSVNAIEYTDDRDNNYSWYK
jgi:hypothetical protein